MNGVPIDFLGFFFKILILGCLAAIIRSNVGPNLFFPSHYLLGCTVTISPEFREQLTIEEYGLSLQGQAILILKRLDSNLFGTRWV